MTAAVLEDALQTADAGLVPPQFRGQLPTLRVYSPEEASKILKGLKTAYWLVKNARADLIPHTRVGKTICFTLQNLVDLVQCGDRTPKRFLTAP